MTYSNTPVRLRYDGAIPSEDIETTIFNSVTAFPGPKGHAGRGCLANYGFSMLQVTITADQNADNELNLYHSEVSPPVLPGDSGDEDWILVAAVNDVDVTSGLTTYQFNIEGFTAICLTFTNGTAPVTAFSANMVLSYDRTNAESPFKMSP